ncbi:MAG: His-Xaa-Ser system radical SAM maturase HxsB [Patescibacteria group bacterium]|nr:His-Xaa-Ser system radical SAM maturase HxsB [Patescibacteria group bacterium]
MLSDLKKIKYNKLGFFRFKKIKDKYLLTNDVGGFLFLTKKEFKDFLSDNLEKDKEPYLSLNKKSFIKKDLDLTESIDKYRLKNSFLFNGPSLHIVVVTLRCNHKCVYCHASAQAMDRTDLDMDKETAKNVVEKIFQTTSPFVAIEFQGGEPLVNWPIVKFIIEEAYKKNKKAKKDLEIRLVSNFSLMTEEKFKYLLDKNVSFCVSIDGPEKVHNKNRPMVKGNSYYYATKWSKKFFKLYPQLRKKGYIFKIGLSVTISRFSLSYYKEIVDEYIKLGFDDFYLGRPLNPFGLLKESFKKIGYTADEYINFYKNALSYIIGLNLKGKKVREKAAVTFLKKILTEKDPNHLDFRSPCGAGIGQLAYNYNGNVYTCDEGRMMSMMNDESFCLGNVKENTYQEIVGNPIVRTLCTASCLDGLAGCDDCAYKPYCGICPIYNYAEQGNIFGQMPTNERCKINKAMISFLFEKLQDPKIKEIFKKWLDK